MFLALFVALFVQLSFAQQRTVTGTVSDDKGMPISGANVVVKGAKSGVQTDLDGKFSIKAESDQTLVITYVGFNKKEVSASSNNLKIKLQSNAVELEGVVVTALGIKRDKKSLGYASQKLDGSQINSSPTSNFLNNLAGKVAGLEVKNNANFGGSSNLVLRGMKSLTGNNQALIVVDGVPINNTVLNTSSAQSSGTGFDFGNSGADIDPNNIESVNILKGAAATALYGSSAANGAVMITTKKGKKNTALGVSFSSTITTGAIDKSTFAKYQKEYGGGGYDGHDNFIYDQDINGDGINDILVPTGYDISYGNVFNPNQLVYQWNAFAPGNPNYGKATPWVAAANDPSKFFERSFATTNNINFNGGDETSTYNFSFTNNQDKGVMPNSKLLKNVISGNFSREFGSKLTLTTSLTYTDQSVKGRNSVGYGDNILSGFRQWWQTNVDVKELQQEYFRDEKNVTWNMNDPASGDYTPAYWNNPYWDRYQNYETDSRKRLILSSNLSYDITKKLNFVGRVSLDNSHDRQEQRKAIGSHAENFGTYLYNQGSGYELYTLAIARQTYDGIFTYNTNLYDNLGLKLLAGAQLIHQSSNSYDGSTNGGLVLPNLYTLANSSSFIAPLTSDITYKKTGLYGQASFDYKKTLFLEGTIRKDESTALHPNSNSYVYTSASTSLMFSEFLKSQTWLNSGKVRISYAEVGNDPAAGLLGYKTYVSTLGTNPYYTNSTVYVNFEKLKPEIESSWEYGLESSMFNNRLSLDLSYYKTTTKDQIFRVPQSTSTSVSSSLINAGNLENKGIEVSVLGTPIKMRDFQWQIGVNWSQNRNKLLSLDEGRTNLQLASFQSGITLNATVGEPYGTIKGSDYVYDNNGNKIVGNDGNYLQNTKKDNTIGNIQAKWRGGISNKFSYKNLSLSFLIDIKKGGDVFSLDQGYGQDTGLYPETAGLNDLGYPVRNTLQDGGGYINEGVMLNPAYTPTNGQPQYITNTIRVDASDSSEASGSGFGISANPDKAYVYDGSFVKLREAAFTYSLPSKFFNDTFIKGISLSLIGNNLWIIHKNLPYADPEAGTSAGNIQGYQSGVMPTVRTYSFNFKVNF
ncbi:SusC/RagA family TonB-linked outer membrane protein [Flavobacterium croceum]|uniref:SusC/RagA family TonB-linked outer membrane protein n=1 Tax=Flavobacterium croceum TaxID=370975 RepID=UPI0024A9C6BF|nr:SusC/RagA family TonB-linked outer membrane protein [Flavobacterium croceum]